MRRNIVDSDGTYLLVKHPDEANKLYTVDWTDRLEGRVISTASCAGASGITLNGVSWNNTAVQLDLSGGTAGTDYDMDIQVVTDTGETLVAPIRVRVTNTPYYAA